MKRISLSVLVDNDLRWETVGKKLNRVLVPPSVEKLKTIRELVGGIAGLSTERGDVLVVESLPFESTLSSEPPSNAPVSAPAIDPRIPKWLAPLLSDGKSFAVAAAAGAVMVLILFGLLFLLLGKGKSKKPGVKLPTELPGAVAATQAVATTTAAADSGPSSPLSVKTEAERLRAREEAQQRLDEQLADQMDMSAVSTQKGEYLVKNLRENIKKDSNGVTNVLRNWISEKQTSETM